MTAKRKIAKKAAPPVAQRRLPIDVRMRALELAVSVSAIDYVPSLNGGGYVGNQVPDRRKRNEDTAAIIKAAEAFLGFLA